MDTIFWIFSKLLWVLVSPDNIVIILLIAGTAFLWTKRNTLGRLLITIAVAVILLVGFLPVNNFLLWPLENRFTPPSPLPENVSGIIVLSGPEQAVITATRGQPAVNEGAERLTTFVALARRYPDAKLIHTGGSGSLYQQEYTATPTAKQLFKELGLNPDRVQFESNARNTFENAINSFNMIGKKPEGNWILVTAAFHMPRSVGVFRKIGWNVIPYPVDYRTTGQLKHDWNFGSLFNFYEVTKGLHEWAGMTAYWITGKSSELFPGPTP